MFVIIIIKYKLINDLLIIHYSTVVPNLYAYAVRTYAYFVLCLNTNCSKFMGFSYSKII